MLGFFKKSGRVNQFAIDHAIQLYSNIPELADCDDPDNLDKKLDKKIEAQLKIIITDINTFKNINKLGIYHKAKLHLVFTEKLVEMGVNKQLAEHINKAILIGTP